MQAELKSVGIISLDGGFKRLLSQNIFYTDVLFEKEAPCRPISGNPLRRFLENIDVVGSGVPERLEPST